MREPAVLAALGKQPYDLVIKNVQIVNVFNDTVNRGSVGIAGGLIACIGGKGDFLQRVTVSESGGMGDKTA